MPKITTLFYWSSFPFIRILLPFILGVLLSNFSIFNDFSFYFWCGILTVLLLFIWFHESNKSYSKRWLGGLLVALLFVLFGSGYSIYFNSKFQPPEVDITQNTQWIGKVKNVNESGDNIKSLLVHIHRLKLSSWENTAFNLLVYNRDSTLRLSVGDYVSAKSYIKPTLAPQNPAQFNYQNFLARKNVFYTAFENEFLVKQSDFSLTKLASESRKRVITIYKSIGIDEDELSVLIALTLGDKSQLSFAQKEDFAGAGAMHILAVSGLHVGIVFLLFSWLFKFLPDRKFFRVFQGVFILILIWLFAFIAGFSPSVQRAAWMFSFVIMAKILNSNSNILNSISVSAFLLILINPNVIYQLGFLLSYSAVVGIILIHPIIYNFYSPKYWLIDKAWNLIVVSIAAQIATLPFTLFYFHQFPLYFLLTNLIVIPIAFVVVAGGVICSFSVLLFNTDFLLGYVLNGFLWFLNKSVFAINQIPYAVVKGIYINVFSFALLLLGIWLFVLFLHSIKRKILLISLSAFLLLFIIEFYDDYKQLSKKQITFYALSQPSFSYVNGLNGEMYFTEKARDYDKKLIREHLASLGVKKIDTHLVTLSNNILQIEDKTILTQFNNHKPKDISANIDVVLFTESSRIINYEEAKLLDFTFRNENELLGISNSDLYYNVKKEEAYVMKLD